MFTHLADKGVRIAVDELGKVKDIADRNGTSQSLAHVQIAHPDDQKRIGELGISVVFTFVWATPGVQYEMMVVPFIDEIDGVADLYNPDSYYMQNAYPARSVQDVGRQPGQRQRRARSATAIQCLSPVCNKRYSGVTERSCSNEAQRIDIHSAIEAFTINGARLFGHEDMQWAVSRLGRRRTSSRSARTSLRWPKIDRPDEISNTEVTLTVFDGRIVHDSD